ncbi:MAG TPA: DUF1622 domain-containing protein [Dehalococcoidia bacterium]|jgi:uncharacterized membrane protein
MIHLEDLKTSHGWIEHAGTAIELFGVAVIVVGVVVAAVLFGRGLLGRSNHTAARSQRLAEDMRRRIGRTLLLGLEILVAADIIRTVALSPTMESLGTLGLLVLIRTFLSWSIVLEIEGRWPWQHASPAEGNAAAPLADVPQATLPPKA